MITNRVDDQCVIGRECLRTSPHLRSVFPCTGRYIPVVRGNYNPVDFRNLVRHINGPSHQRFAAKSPQVLFLDSLAPAPSRD